MRHLSSILWRGLFVAAVATCQLVQGELPTEGHAPVNAEPIPYHQQYEAMETLRQRAEMSDEELLEVEQLDDEDDIEQLVVTRSLKKAAAQESQQYQAVAVSFSAEHSAANHQVWECNPLGDFVTLLDGSQWVVNPKDQQTVQSWGQGTPVFITPHKVYFFKSGYAFRLVDRATGNYARVNMVKGPHVQSSYFRYITFIDYVKEIVVLNDNSVWSVSGTSKVSLQDWLPNHIVSIGINDDWFSFKPHILLNVTRYNFLPAKIKY